MSKQFKIYFAASITGGRQDAHIYEQLLQILQKHGTVLTEHCGSTSLSGLGENLPAAYVHDRDIDWVHEADVFVGEVSVRSDGVGYEFGRVAERNVLMPENKKSILCLYRPSFRPILTKMLKGNVGITCEEYETIEEVELIIDNFFESL